MNRTAIQWTDVTWNPVRGCSRVSEGCRHCYAEGIAARFSGGPRQRVTEAVDPDVVESVEELPAGPFHGFARMTDAGPRWTGRVELIPSKLAEPLRMRSLMRDECEPCMGSGSDATGADRLSCGACEGRGYVERPRRIFVNSTSDLFHESLPNEQIAAVFGVMAACPRHTFQVLTKRAQRLPEWFDWISRAMPSAHPQGAARGVRWYAWNGAWPAAAGVLSGDRAAWVWPLPNVWLGVSVEDRANLGRLDALRATPAAVRFASFEPLLEDLGEHFLRPTCDSCRGAGRMYGSKWTDDESWLCRACNATGRQLRADTGIDWAIFGGESGPNARPCDVAWIREGVRQCREAGVAAFVKQLGSNITWDVDVSAGNYTKTRFPEQRDLQPRGDGTYRIRLNDSHGGNPDEWPDDLRVREFPR